MEIFINSQETMCNSRKCLQRDISHWSENEGGRQNTETRDGLSLRISLSITGKMPHSTVSYISILSKQHFPIFMYLITLRPDSYNFRDLSQIQEL